MGDYIQVTTERHVDPERECHIDQGRNVRPDDDERSADNRLFAVWTDLRNQVINAQGVLQQQNDIFLQSYLPNR